MQKPLPKQGKDFIKDYTKLNYKVIRKWELGNPHCQLPSTLFSCQQAQA